MEGPVRSCRRTDPSHETRLRAVSCPSGSRSLRSGLSSAGKSEGAIPMSGVSASSDRRATAAKIPDGSAPGSHTAPPPGLVTPVAEMRFPYDAYLIQHPSRTARCADAALLRPTCRNHTGSDACLNASRSADGNGLLYFGDYRADVGRSSVLSYHWSARMRTGPVLLFVGLKRSLASSTRESLQRTMTPICIVA